MSFQTSRRRCLSGSSSFMILSFSALFFSSLRVCAASWRWVWVCFRKFSSTRARFLSAFSLPWKSKEDLRRARLWKLKRGYKTASARHSPLCWDAASWLYRCCRSPCSWEEAESPCLWETCCPCQALHTTQHHSAQITQIEPNKYTEKILGLKGLTVKCKQECLLGFGQLQRLTVPEEQGVSASFISPIMKEDEGNTYSCITFGPENWSEKWIDSILSA